MTQFARNVHEFPVRISHSPRCDSGVGNRIIFRPESQQRQQVSAPPSPTDYTIQFEITKLLIYSISCCQWSSCKKKSMNFSHTNPHNSYFIYVIQVSTNIANQHCLHSLILSWLIAGSFEQHTPVISGRKDGGVQWWSSEVIDRVVSVHQYKKISQQPGVETLISVQPPRRGSHNAACLLWAKDYDGSPDCSAK